jgi:SAM-dependent methyltransferase
MQDDPRSWDRLRHHFEVERELAQRLLHSTRDQRTRLFSDLYGELFSRVPDHPRLTRRETPEDSRRAVAARMMLLREHLPGVKTFLELAPGDCRLAFEVCRHVETVIGVDISDQSGSLKEAPKNFKLVVYDGYHIELPDDSVDLAFSYQFLEHLHPEDVASHMQLIHRLLKPGGIYIFDTPHRYSGPHDISVFFSDTPQGFHLKEWTYGEMAKVIRDAGFREWFTFRKGRARMSGAVNALTLAAETGVGWLPRWLKKRISAHLFQSVAMLVRK